MAALEKKRMDHTHFMQQALIEADKAMAAGEFPVGCILVHQNRIVVRGGRQSSRAEQRNELDHAEMIALRRLNRLPDRIQPQELTLYCTMEPCLMCFAALMLAGIGRIVYAYEDVMGGGTGCNFDGLSPLYQHARPQVIGGVMRQESLARFQTFFSGPKNDYWRDSTLAIYTQSQEPTALEN